MSKGILVALILFLSITETKAQLGAMMLAGNGTNNYKLGFGAFIKAGFPADKGSYITLEGGVDVFPSDNGDKSSEGTTMCPLQVGYRYTFNQTGE